MYTVYTRGDIRQLAIALRIVGATFKPVRLRIRATRTRGNRRRKFQGNVIVIIIAIIARARSRYYLASDFIISANARARGRWLYLRARLCVKRNGRGLTIAENIVETLQVETLTNSPCSSRATLRFTIYIPAQRNAIIHYYTTAFSQPESSSEFFPRKINSCPREKYTIKSTRWISRGCAFCHRSRSLNWGNSEL